MLIPSIKNICEILKSSKTVCPAWLRQIQKLSQARPGTGRVIDKIGRLLDPILYNPSLTQKRTLHDRSPAATACPPTAPLSTALPIRTRANHLLLTAWVKFEVRIGKAVDVAPRKNNPPGVNTHNDS